jgi:hypothetical protein
VLREWKLAKAWIFEALTRGCPGDAAGKG